MRNRHVFALLLCVVVWGRTSEAALVQVGVGDLLPDMMSVEFESAGLGPIAGTDPVFAPVGVDEAFLVGTHVAVGDTLSSGFFGRALVSQGNTLAVAAPGQAMDNQQAGAGYGFRMDGTATQFGFRVVDQINHAMRLQTYANGVLLDDIAYNPSGSFPNPIVYFQSDVAFDEFRAFSPNGSGGWGLDGLTTAGRAPASVPEPATLTMFGLGLLLIGGRFRRRLSPNTHAG